MVVVVNVSFSVSCLREDLALWIFLHTSGVPSMSVLYASTCSVLRPLRRLHTRCLPVDLPVTPGTHYGILGVHW
jgi:hypothetical protein